MMLRNLYGIALGTSGLIFQAQSREEILADKMVNLAFRENRIKNQTPSLPDAHPRPGHFRCGGRKSSFLAD